MSDANVCACPSVRAYTSARVYLYEFCWSIWLDGLMMTKIRLGFETGMTAHRVCVCLFAFAIRSCMWVWVVYDHRLYTFACVLVGFRWVYVCACIGHRRTQHNMYGRIAVRIVKFMCAIMCVFVYVLS